LFSGFSFRLCAFAVARLDGLELAISTSIMSAGIVKASNSKKVFERQARICQAFAHPARLQILDLLGSGEQGVSELQETLGIPKTRISQHLTILKSAGVLSTRRNGKQVLCSLAIPEVKQACQMIRKVLEAHLEESHRLIE
jgi:ArsR family transcriptional regulator